jgi:hypothetical protein
MVMPMLAYQMPHRDPAVTLVTVEPLEPDLVAAGIAVRDHAHAVRIGFPLHRVESPLSGLRDERVEVSASLCRTARAP